MDVVLVPGFWLTAATWDPVLPAIRAAGHRPHPLTLPGLESVDADRSGITLADHVDAVVQAIDSCEGKVALVGHSGGGVVAYDALDARVDRVDRMIYVDTWPLAHGMPINDTMPVVDSSVPFPGWDEFEDVEYADLDDATRARFEAEAIPQPAAAVRSPQTLVNPERRAVPSTIILSTASAEDFRKWMASGSEWMAETASLENLSLVELPAGHWPQLSRPEDLAVALVDALS
jgi:pimeloyl-ACP methyl ester carboxylesterase